MQIADVEGALPALTTFVGNEGRQTPLQLSSDASPQKATRVMRAMLQIEKNDTAALQRAYDHEYNGWGASWID